MTGRVAPHLLVAATAIALGASVSAAADTTPAARTSAVSHMQVTAREYFLTTSRASVRPSTLKVEMVNYGEDDHDLAVMRKGGGTAKTIGVVHPGDRAMLSVKVRRGQYVLWCTITDHKQRGMRAVLRVKN